MHYWYAQAHLRRNELEQAKEALKTALKYDPAYRTARLNLAELEEQTGAFEPALSDARNLLSSDPADLQAALLYSKILISKKDYTDAKTLLKPLAENAATLRRLTAS